MYTSHVFSLLDGWQRVEEITVVNAVADIVVYGEIAYSEARQVLEEVRSLTWVDAIVGQSCLDNDLCSRYVWPLDRHSEP